MVVDEAGFLITIRHIHEATMMGRRTFSAEEFLAIERVMVKLLALALMRSPEDNTDE